jgi:hypothetical protein
LKELTKLKKTIKKVLLAVILCVSCASGVVAFARKGTKKPWYWNLTPEEFMEINPWGSMDRDYWSHWYSKHPEKKPAGYVVEPGVGTNLGAREFIKKNPDIPEKIKQKMLGKKRKRRHHAGKSKHHRRHHHGQKGKRR